ncbi:hypothetical protein ACIQK9_09190 [Streptomyces hydrogenans]|uniref:hypothetical protein n=1 Tax=Streptomyces hydrogenans TaxID=1873719 RepID=UPI00382BA0B4
MTSTSFHGVGGVFLLGTGSLALGAAALPLVRSRHARFFREGRSAVADPTVDED